MVIRSTYLSVARELGKVHEAGGVLCTPLFRSRAATRLFSAHVCVYIYISVCAWCVCVCVFPRPKGECRAFVIFGLFTYKIERNIERSIYRGCGRTADEINFTRCSLYTRSFNDIGKTIFHSFSSSSSLLPPLVVESKHRLVNPFS